MPEKTRAEFRADGCFITGDLGRIDATATCTSSAAARISSSRGGFNVYPREVEDELDALPGVAESAVFGVPHPDFGEGVVGGGGAAGGRSRRRSEGAILARLRERLAGYKCPKRVLFVDELPRNAMGKVQKNLLREQYLDLY